MEVAWAGGGHSDARRARLSPGGCLQPPGGCLQPPDRLAVQPVGSGHNLFDAIGLVGAPPIELSRFDQRTGKTYIINTFQTFTLPFFTDLHQKWYRQVDGKNVKVLPGNIADLLTSVALAFWISSDCTFDQSQGSIVLCTDSFTVAEVDTLRSILLDKYGINSSRTASNKAKGQYRIPKREVPKLQPLVSPHMPDCMRYRIGL